VADDVGTIGNSEDPVQNPEQDPQKQAAQWNDYWVKEIAAGKRWLRDFHSQGTRVEDRYLGVKNSGSGANDEGGTSSFNIFWSNIQVILSAIFSRPPKPEINRSHLDPNDDVARVAATILRRIFEAQFMLPDTSHVATSGLKRLCPGSVCSRPRSSVGSLPHGY
jgi:hypothetical protein